MEDIIFNAVLTGVLLVFLCVIFIKSTSFDSLPEKLAISVVLLGGLSVSVSIFGTITLIWIR